MKRSNYKTNLSIIFHYGYMEDYETHLERAAQNKTTFSSLSNLTNKADPQKFINFGFSKISLI